MIGLLSLNLSFVLHLFIYLPQVLHNRSSQNIKNLSINMHLILFFCYFLDIFYGFSSKMQWQYKTVSIVGFSLLIIQYLQIISFLNYKKSSNMATLHTVILAISIYFVIYFFMNDELVLSETEILYAGFISKILFIISALPQIIKNYKLESSSAISIYFIYLSITIATLDTISAWYLNWGWPNKITSPIVIFMMMLLLPYKKYIRSLKEA